MTFGIGVLGATGFIGVPYRREIREAPDDAHIVALCARRKDLLEKAAAEDGATLTTDDWRQVVEHPDVDLVLVLTPDALHREAVLACAAAGKHVFCEKPVGVNAAEAEEMWTAVNNAGLAHYVPFWTRYVPLFARARQLYREGLLGEMKAVVYRWHNPRPAAMPYTWRDDATLSAAGSIADVGSHAYDAMRWILDDEAEHVVANGGVISDPKPDLGAVNLEEAIAWGQQHQVSDSTARKKGTAFDYASISFNWKSGAVGTLVLSHAGFLRKGLAPELELHGRDASLALDRIRGTLTIARGGDPPELLETVSEPETPVNRFREHVFPALRARVAGQPCEHPGLDDGWKVQQFTDAAAAAATLS